MLNKLKSLNPQLDRDENNVALSEALKWIFSGKREHKMYPEVPDKRKGKS